MSLKRKKYIILNLITVCFIKIFIICITYVKQQKKKQHSYKSEL